MTDDDDVDGRSSSSSGKGNALRAQGIGPQRALEADWPEIGAAINSATSELQQEISLGAVVKKRRVLYQATSSNSSYWPCLLALAIARSPLARCAPRRSEKGGPLEDKGGGESFARRLRC